MSNQLRLKYECFVPSSLDRQMYSKNLSMVEDLAPADSYVDYIICKLADGTYRTIINIRSVCGKFYSEAQGISPLVSLQQAKKSILNTLEDWKKWRF